MSQGSGQAGDGADRVRPNQDPPRNPPPAAGADDAARSELNSELLERVVRETLSAVNDESTIERIQAFARRHGTREITEPDVAEALLQLIVSTRFGKLALPPELPGWLAQTLLDDPDAAARLQTLWEQARQAQP